jgi:basic amino acid/polyamine antiporter, APA family
MSVDTSKIKKLGLITTSAFVIANMVGTGVFTTLGFQLSGTENLVAILLLWIIGGIIALCGSLVYSELGAAMPRSGGEYHYLTKIYHPYVGFLSGWVSITVGFAAPVALAAMALGNYSTRVIPSLSPVSIALSVVLIISFIHSLDVKLGGSFQNVFTSFKILLISFFIICGFILTPSFQNLTPSFNSFSFKELLKPEFFVLLIYVSYSFSGWNASAYIASEIDKPQKTIPRSLLISTLIVTILYFFLNLTFILTTPAAELKGQLEVGYISASKIFGPTGGGLMAMLISILLISTISSLVFVGPRVSQVMGEDMKLLKFLSEKSQRGTPVYAILLQFILSFFMIITSTFESVLTYAGFTLSLFTFITVFGVFIHRHKFKDAERPYKTWGYPTVPIIFLVITLMTLVYLVYQRPYESLMGFITLLSGSILYLINIWYEKKPEVSEKQ